MIGSALTMGNFNKLSTFVQKTLSVDLGFADMGVSHSYYVDQSSAMRKQEAKLKAYGYDASVSRGLVEIYGSSN